MWSLSIVFLFALNTFPQNGQAPDQDFRANKLAQMSIESKAQQNGPAEALDFRTQSLPQFKSEVKDLRRRTLEPRLQSDMCFAIRSYVFHREDGQAPKLVNTTTCTPASTLRTLQTSPAPPARLVPAK